MAETAVELPTFGASCAATVSTVATTTFAFHAGHHGFIAPIPKHDDGNNDGIGRCRY